MRGTATASATTAGRPYQCMHAGLAAPAVLLHALVLVLLHATSTCAAQPRRAGAGAGAALGRDLHSFTFIELNLMYLSTFGTYSWVKLGCVGHKDSSS